mgnify:CR=1 FL=1
MRPQLKFLDDALREVFLLGREGIRHVVLDPLLPDPLIDEQKRSSMVQVLQDYCDKGIDLWAQFLQLDLDGRPDTARGGPAQKRNHVCACLQEQPHIAFRLRKQ